VVCSSDEKLTLWKEATRDKHKRNASPSTMNLATHVACLPDRNESAQSFLVRTDALAVLTAQFENGVRARTLLTRIGVSRAVAMSTGQALDVWFVCQPSVGELVTVLAAMFERDAARAVGLVEMYDEIVMESESYDGDPAPLWRRAGASARRQVGVYRPHAIIPVIFAEVFCLLRDRLTSARPGTPLTRFSRRHHTPLSATAQRSDSSCDSQAEHRRIAIAEVAWHCCFRS
jgi:hypothetical protein